MKLQTKINYRFIVLLLLVFMVAGVVLYFTLGLTVNHYMDHSLRNKSRVFKQSLTQNYVDVTTIGSFDKSVVVSRIGQSMDKNLYYDTLIFNPHDKEFDVYRKMVFGFASTGKFYQATIVAAKFEAEDMVELIFYFMLAIFAMIVLILFFLNRWLSTSLWSPFYKTLHQLQTFRMEGNELISFETCNVFEFEQLNNSLQIMMQKIQADFKNLKEFTENASHEIQTPLAIIKTKLENILQDKTLDTSQNEQIQIVYNTTSRLSKLNEALLLLSKIENKQFPDSAEINLVELVKQRLELIQELNLKIFRLNLMFNSHL